MSTADFPALDHSAIAGTRDALHAYARVLGDWLKSCRARRKHWWHASLRPSLNGLTTGVVHAGIDFELELSLREGLLHGRTSTGAQLSEPLRGQSACELALSMERFLLANGIDSQLVPETDGRGDGARSHPGYSAEQAHTIARAFNWVATAM